MRYARYSLITPQNNLTHATNDQSGVGRLPMESNQILLSFYLETASAPQEPLGREKVCMRKYQAAARTTPISHPLTNREEGVQSQVPRPAFRWSRRMERGRNDRKDPCLMSPLCWYASHAP